MGPTRFELATSCLKPFSVCDAKSLAENRGRRSFPNPFLIFNMFSFTEGLFFFPKEKGLPG